MSAHTPQTELKLIGKLILEGEMLCETGLHVGAGKGSLEIGGSDNPVVKDAFGRPYVPCRPNSCTSRAAKARKFAFTRAIVPTTKSASCSAAIPAGWSASRAKRWTR